MRIFWGSEGSEGSSESALALEYIFGSGVKTGKWLGVAADARRASGFDDIRYKIDEIVTIAGGDEPVWPFGVDVTVNANGEEIADKLRRSHNNPSIQLPEGCSRVIYYEHGAERRSLPLVPRYVVAMQAGYVLGIVRSDIDMDMEGNIGMNPNTRKMRAVRQRILSELYAQAELRLNQLQLIAPMDMTDDEADAFDAIAAQKDIFDAVLAEVEATIAAETPSFRGISSKSVRELLKERSAGSDRAYAVLMAEIDRMSREVAERKVGAGAVDVLRKTG